MIWILHICTAGWVLCGQEVKVEYPNEQSCYRAMEDLYRRNNPDKFKYVICKPKAQDATP